MVSYHLPSLVAIGIVVVEIIWFQFVMWSGKTTWSKGYVILWVGTPHCKSTIMPSLVAIGIEVVEI